MSKTTASRIQTFGGKLPERGKDGITKLYSLSLFQCTDSSQKNQNYNEIYLLTNNKIQKHPNIYRPPSNLQNNTQQTKRQPNICFYHPTNHPIKPSNQYVIRNLRLKLLSDGLAYPKVFLCFNVVFSALFNILAKS